MGEHARSAAHPPSLSLLLSQFSSLSFYQDSTSCELFIAIDFVPSSTHPHTLVQGQLQLMSVQTITSL
jgi:hypothetical protein